jgi:hypothetical protein
MEADNQAMLKGLGVGLVVAGIIGGVVWYNLPKQSS